MPMPTAPRVQSKGQAHDGALKNGCGAIHTFNTVAAPRVGGATTPSGQAFAVSSTTLVARHRIAAAVKVESKYHLNRSYGGTVAITAATVQDNTRLMWQLVGIAAMLFTTRIVSSRNARP